MTSLILKMSISLDGYVAPADGSSDWEAAGRFPTAPMNEIPQVVFSNSLTSADWGETTITTGDLLDAVARSKGAASRVGSGGGESAGYS